MIKAKQGNMLIFGLSDRNMELLKEGKPIKFNLKEAQLSEHDIDIFIFNGRTEDSMYESMIDLIDLNKTKLL